MPILTEIGQVGVTTEDGREYTLHPSFFNIASIGSPEEIVSTYADLHGADAVNAARVVILCCGGDLELVGAYREPGLMPDSEQIIIARHLMQHGIVGRVKKSGGSGKYSPRFDAAEYILAAQAHFGMTRADAGELTMTEFSMLLDMKFPEQKQHEKPTQEDYRALERAIEEKRKAKNG